MCQLALPLTRQGVFGEQGVVDPGRTGVDGTERKGGNAGEDREGTGDRRGGGGGRSGSQLR